MLLRGWTGLAISWGWGGALYGLVVSLSLGLAGDVRDSLLLMLYVGLAFIGLGSLLYWLRAGIRALLRKKGTGSRSLPACVVASFGGFLLGFSVLLALGDFIMVLAFNPQVSWAWLISRDVLFVAGGGVSCWLLAGPASRGIDRLPVKLRDWKALAALWLLVVVPALLAPLLGASTLRFERQRAGPPEGLEVQDTGLRVLVFGIDAATWKVFSPLIEDGSLPVTAKLVEGGVHATLISPPPQVSPAIWTTMVTGRRPEEHGVEKYLRVSLPGVAGFPFESLAQDMSLVPFFWVGLGYFMAGMAEGVPPTSDQVRVKTLWHMLADGGERSMVLGWPATWPAEPLPGLIVSDRFGPGELDMFSPPRESLGSLVHPPGARARLDALTVDSQGDPRPMLEKLADLSEQETVELIGYAHNPLLPTAMELLTALYDSDLSYLGFMRSEIAAGYRLALIMIKGPDMAMHAFFPDRFPEDFGLKQARHPGWGRIIDTIHALVDEKIGEIIAAASEDTVVLIISDHGMDADPRNFIWPGWHGPEALLILAGGPVRAGGELKDVGYLDVAPTILYLLGYPVPEDIPGRVLTEAITEEFLQKYPVRKIPSYE
jgi:predicted AlkP superfamily phosphohydrolase/phosphomutase